jgi:hypothetical protein
MFIVIIAAFLGQPVFPQEQPHFTFLTVQAPSINHNHVHFGQAQGTPFTVPPLSEDLTFDGATSSADMILEGNYDSSGLANIT